MKRINDSKILTELSNYLGNLNSTHCSPKQMKNILKQFIKYGNNTLYIKTLLNMLNNIISGVHIQDFFFFNGEENSFILLKNNITVPSNGLCMTGYIRFEGNGLTQDQCIFSFLSEVGRDVKGIELFVKKNSLVYRTINSFRETPIHEFPFEHSCIRKDVWHHISVFHMHKEIIIFLDNSMWNKEIIENAPFAKSYNFALLGASFDFKKTRKTCCHFNGEMSAICFFPIRPNSREFISNIADCENIWQYLHINKEYKGTFFSKLHSWDKLDIFQEGLMQASTLVIDPKVK